MARFRYSHSQQGGFLPIIPDEQLVHGTLEHSIHYLIEEKLDLTQLMKEYHKDEKHFGPSSKDFLKVIFLAFLRGIYFIRKIERVCRENMVFMFLCGDSQDSQEGILAYSRRICIVEPDFANITNAKGLNRFRYRGKKVNSIWTLYCLIHNIEKVHIDMENWNRSNQ